MNYDLGTVISLWRRDWLRLRKERSRWAGIVAQPILFWLVIGSGMSDVFHHAGGSDYLSFFYPGILVMIVLFTTIFSTISLIEDRQTGFLQSVLVAPGSRASVVMGKFAGVLTVVAIQVALFLLLAPAAGFPFLSIRWLALIVCVALGCITLTGITFTMAWALPSSQAYHAIMSVVLIPLWMISGAMFPAPDSWLGVVMRFNPMTYFVDASRVAFGSPADTMLSPVGTYVVLTATAAISTAMAVAVSKRNAARFD